MDNNLRLYTGTEEKYEKISPAEILKVVKANPKHLQHYKKHGMWICVNQINRKRRFISA